MASNAAGKLLGEMSRDQLDRLAAVLVEMRVCWDATILQQQMLLVLRRDRVGRASESSGGDGPMFAEKLLAALRTDIDNRS